ncbi:hypothetical protein NQ317_005517 [Molorchus minor]|uniref:Uncharacterized protein n=1 Tax=Molorchus minor TaxID=1323400 RepID=A0ABQ9IS09_9CUCU|nr:hypothetical protein NQ317_005517 [Molorchus minor]
MLLHYLWIFRRIDGKLFYFPKNSDKGIYEDWPHHLLLKTCYRTSANLSDGSVLVPTRLPIHVYPWMYPRKFHIDRISVQKYLPYRFQGHIQMQ